MAPTSPIPPPSLSQKPVSAMAPLSTSKTWVRVSSSISFPNLIQSLPIKLTTRNHPSRPPNILASRLHSRIPRPPPHSPRPLLPPPLTQPLVPANPLLRPHNPALFETRARNPLRAPLLRRHDASVQSLQEQRPLLAARWPEHRHLHLPPFIPRGGALESVHHVAERRVVRGG